MDPGERQDLVEELLAALSRAHAPAAVRLLDLMRVEQNLSDSLAVIRREIAAIVRAVSDDDETGGRGDSGERALD